MILIPVKNLATAKQRLASLFSQAVRTQLAQAMFLDVLDAVAACSHRPSVSLVTSDPFAIDAAQQFGFDVIPDNQNRSETDAIELATRTCESRGVDSTLVIPADVPLITSSELDMIFTNVPERGSLLVPAADGRGTNAAFRRPAALFPLRFGNDSFKPHLATAKASGLPCTVISLSGIGLDIDNPSDLRKLVDAPGNTRAQNLARQWDMTDLSLAANQ
ncbi:MAG: 2-phospho-L-lactate guanylyltransferase [Acidobacteriaceae bacterium]|nr:2-phospho-L-lactate guanylyltransferase [Acidobacteriaceae bacterium]